MAKNDTESFEKKLDAADNYDDFFEENSSQLKHIHPGEYILALMEEKNFKKTEIISKVNINTGYVYEILRNEKHPERDKMLQFAFALDLNIDETQNLLKRCGYAQLYCRNHRDSIIIFCINRKATLGEANALLNKYEFSEL